jgi:hypothetical protein
MSASNRYFGEDIVTFSVEINGTSIVAGGVKDVVITPVGEHTNLFDAESVKRREVRRSEVTVDVEFTIVEFNNELAAYWLEGNDSADPSTPTSINDTSEVAQFDITLEQDMTETTGTSGDPKGLKADVDGVDFPELPLLELAEGEFNEHSFSGTGDDATIEQTTIA